MEADWEMEVGSDAPVIDADWPGFVDLRIAPSRVNEIVETHLQPGLADALVRLNAAGSPVWTCKTDIFVPERVDADELDAPHDHATHAIACYLDLLMRGDHAWSVPSDAEHACKLLCARLRAIPLQCCRVDLVIRKAVATGMNGVGVTAYLTACGQTPAEARSRLNECLSAFVEGVGPRTK